MSTRARLPQPHVFGIRHHGPGSSRSLCEALAALAPDCLMIEGPPDANDHLSWAADPEMAPPVALLIYRPDQPQRAAYYPFADFSPEWQALHYAQQHQIPARFMDLPQANQLAQPPEKDRTPRNDPIAWLAKAAGYDDHERWWNHLVEQRQDSTDLFQAILDVMSLLRTEANAQRAAEGSTPADEHNDRREAAMRLALRAAHNEGYDRIAVVCGAWHAPALLDFPSASADKARLKGLPRKNVTATWVPWTYGRLAQRSGYGAGIRSPGWYDHLWRHGQAGLTPQGVAIRWLTRVAELLRAEELPASPADVIEATRLAETLATIRGRPLPGLEEFNEAVQTVLCFGDPLPLTLIEQKLTIGERMGAVPSGAPMLPIQRDLQALQKRLRLRPEPTLSKLNLDLRKPMHLERSHLLHRLTVLDISWGKKQTVRKQLGTFNELWRLQWQPDFAVRVVEAALWGTTIHAAAEARARREADKAEHLAQLTELLDRLLMADLPAAIQHILDRLETLAALSSDVGHMMDALPSLARIMRYGNVRGTDATTIDDLVGALITRICLGLPGTCASLDDDAAAELYPRFVATTAVVNTLQQVEWQTQWFEVIERLSQTAGLHGLLAGRCCRILLDRGDLTAVAAARRMKLALSIARDGHAAHGVLASGSTPFSITSAAAWIEGFLRDSGLLLVHDDVLWEVVDEWVAALPTDGFIATLPLLRRTVSTFSAAERRQLGERVVNQSMPEPDLAAGFDHARAAATLPLLRALLGLDDKAPTR